MDAAAGHFRLVTFIAITAALALPLRPGAHCVYPPILYTLPDAGYRFP